jgi:hypothetical protein
MQCKLNPFCVLSLTATLLTLARFGMTAHTYVSVHLRRLLDVEDTFRSCVVSSRRCDGVLFVVRLLMTAIARLNCALPQVRGMASTSATHTAC